MEAHFHQEKKRKNEKEDTMSLNTRKAKCVAYLYVNIILCHNDYVIYFFLSYLVRYFNLINKKILIYLSLSFVLIILHLFVSLRWKCVF